MKFRRLLYPFSIIYGLINQVRNIFYKKNIFKVHKLPTKVISVGNLCLGGTGKTPFVISLIQLLSNDFNNILVLSRGYGRKSKGPKIVSHQGKIQVNIDESGDEPFIIANRFRNTSVVVAEERIKGFELFLKQTNTTPDLVILDDAYQHQAIFRDLNICLMNGFEPYNSDMVFPAGNLREFKNNLNRADCIVETKKNTQFKFNSCATFYIDYAQSTLKPKVDNNKKNILISGISKPRHFESMIKNLDISFDDHLTFKDHHNYTQDDLKNLQPGINIITTEKDYYKLTGLGLTNSIHYLQIDFEFSKELVSLINEKISI